MNLLLIIKNWAIALSELILSLIVLIILFNLLTKGVKINSLLDTSIITNEKMLNLKNENIVNISKGIIKVNKNHLIRLNSILKYLVS